MFLPEGECAFKTYADGLFKCSIVHDRMAVGLRVLVIAIGTAQVALFRKAKNQVHPVTSSRSKVVTMLPAMQPDLPWQNS